MTQSSTDSVERHLDVTPRSRGSRIARYAAVVLGLVLLIGGLGGVKASQIAVLIGFGEAAVAAGPPPEAVNSVVAEKQQWESTLRAVASVVADKGVTVTNDAAGVVAAVHFESGASVKQGQVLLELESSVERAQLLSARAKQEHAELSAKRSQSLATSGVGTQAELDADNAVLGSANAEVAALAAQVARKVVRAPFSGRLGIRAVNLGQYLAPGTPIAVLESTQSVFVDFSMPQRHLPVLADGMSVRAFRDGQTETLGAGVITAIDPNVDAVTRNVRVRATVPNEDQRLRPGMYVTVEVVLPEKRDVIVLPATAVVRAAYGDSVFVVEPKKNESGAAQQDPQGKPIIIGRQQFVKLGGTRGDFVAIEAGLDVGQEVVSGGAFKLINGARIAVDNSVRPKAELDPHPENH